MGFATPAGFALVLALGGCGGPVSGEEHKAKPREPKAAPAREAKPTAHRPLRIRVVAWKTTADGAREKAPVAGATVVARPKDGVVDLATGQTGTDGMVVLDVVRQARGYSLQATGPGFGLQSRQLDEQWPDTHDFPAEIEVEPATGLSLAGRVLDVATGRPISGARVFQNTVNPGRGRPLAQMTTGLDGAFLFLLTPPNGAFVYDGITTNEGRQHTGVRGLVEVAVVAPGYVLVSRVLQVMDGRPCDAGTFHLEPAGTIRGRVLRADGSPFADARIDVLGRMVRSPDGDLWRDMPGFAELETRSAADGTFAFPHAPFDLPLTVGATPYGRWVKTPGVLRQDEDRGLLDAVAGVVVTRAKPDAEVVLREPAQDANRPADLVVEVTSGRPDVALRSVVGQLQRESEWPWTWNSSATSVTGVLSFARVPAGSVRVRVTAQDLAEEVVAVEVDPRKGPTRVSVVLGGTETIEGRVVDETGEPISGATVKYRRDDTWMARVVPAGSQGEFKIDGLPRGRHVLVAQKNDFAAKRIVYVDAPARNVELPLVPAASQAPRAPARSGRAGYPVPGGSGGGVAGVVLGPDGRPVPFAAVYTESAREMCDAEGRFSIAPAAAIHASTEQICPSHAVNMLRLAEVGSSGDVVIRLAATRGVLVDAGRRAPRSAWVEAEPHGDIEGLRPWPDTTRFVQGHVDDRGVAFLRLLPGQWTLRLVVLADDQTDPTTRTQTVLVSTDVTIPDPTPEPGAPSVRITLPAK